MQQALREGNVYTAFTPRSVLITVHCHFLLPTAVWQVSHGRGDGVVD